MSIPQYKPGDKVWVKFYGKGEFPDEIAAWKYVPSEFVSWCSDHPGHYFVALKEWAGACTTMVRPRYDDGDNNKIGDWSHCVWKPGKIPVGKYMADGYKVSH